MSDLCVGLATTISMCVSPEMKYTLEIRKIEKGSDDESLDISSY